MAENINLNKNVFNKRDYTKTIDTSFTQLGVQTIQEQIDEQPTVEEFFILYNQLFYEIPEVGETNSHEYLIKTSSEYINFEETDELVQALQKEIGELREEILQLQQGATNTDTVESEIINPNLETTPVSSGTSGVSGGGGSSGGGGY